MLCLQEMEALKEFKVPKENQGEEESLLSIPESEISSRN